KANVESPTLEIVEARMCGFVPVVGYTTSPPRGAAVASAGSGNASTSTKRYSDDCGGPPAGWRRSHRMNRPLSLIAALAAAPPATVVADAGATTITYIPPSVSATMVTRPLGECAAALSEVTATSKEYSVVLPSVRNTSPADPLVST